MDVFSITKNMSPKGKKRPGKKQRLATARANWVFEQLKEQVKENPELLVALLAKEYGTEVPREFTPAERIRRQIEADQLKNANELLGEVPELSRRLVELELIRRERELGINPQRQWR